MTLISSITQLGKNSNPIKAINSNLNSIQPNNQLILYGSDLAQYLIDLNISINIFGILKLNIHIKI
ncbi:hypothetical protein DDB_G0275681 [Dictyostelium discoideum AX4]|uniref:Uncharacterized protein n=1 Tax=Dictyostelium discoideum TaxID=44689 RepID=Q86HC4_DICDI|nr:hypothetical protein DDB_G0275681 [Dictyostelium discoideum AX4]EAL69591.1 hypothetical protein DDB_G0275681 [Dictyostelium discoideum AX4]|eukprot:XP_643486.1 hypothetical protein DDB_G0275681 [Dictyostelium discoideum AX4]